MQAAETELKVAKTRAASINLPQVTMFIPSGKTVTFVYCGVAVCDAIAAAIKNAAAILGRKVDVIPTNGTPASVKAAWGMVVRLHPAVASGSGVDHSLFASEAMQLQAMYVPVMNWTITDTLGQGITFVHGGLSRCPWSVTGWPLGSSPTPRARDTLYVNLPTCITLQPVIRHSTPTTSSRT